MIGNINENMDCGTTNAEAYPKKEIDNQIYYRPREMGVIYNTAGDTKVKSQFSIVGTSHSAYHTGQSISSIGRVPNEILPGKRHIT